MSTQLKQFAYSKTFYGPLSRVLIIAVLFLLAFFFLSAGETWSVLEGPGRRASAPQNFAANTIIAFVFGAFGFLHLFSFWQNKDRPNAVVLSGDAVTALNQGILRRHKKIPFSDIQRLQKLSVDGVWELKVSSRKTQLRVTRASLADQDDFKRLTECLQDRVPHCTLDTLSRIDPPRMN